jgi:PleD family two-component response regulator
VVEVAVSVSCGAATMMPGVRETGENLLQRADEALYAAKGRKRERQRTAG